MAKLDMPEKFRRIAVLGVTSLGTWAIVPVPAQADEKAASPTVQVAPAGSETAPARPPAHHRAALGSNSDP